MKTVFSNKELVAEWLKQIPGRHGRNSSNNYSFVGRELISYETTVAIHYGSFILRTGDYFSATTQRHSSIRGAEIPCISVRGIFDWGYKFGDKIPTGEEIIAALLTEIPLLVAMHNHPRIRSAGKQRARNGIQSVINHLVMVRDCLGAKIPDGYGTVDEILEKGGVQ